MEQPSSSGSRSARGHQAKKKRRQTGSDSPPPAKQRKATAKRKRIPETIAAPIKFSKPTSSASSAQAPARQDLPPLKPTLTGPTPAGSTPAAPSPPAPGAGTAPSTRPGAGFVQSDTATCQVGDQGVGSEEEAAKSSDEEASRQQLEPAGNQAPLDGAGTSAKDGDSGSDGRGIEGTAKTATVGKDVMAGGSGARAVGEEVIATGKPDAKPAAADKTIAESASANKVVPSTSPAADATQMLPELATKGADGGAALDLIVHDGAGGRERCATSVAMSSGASWCSVGQLARDWVGEVMSQPSSASGDQGTLVPSDAAPLVPATTHRLFTDYRNQLAAFSKDAMARLYHVEKSIIKRTTLFQKVLSNYQTGKSQYQAVKAELARVREQLAQPQALPVDSCLLRRDRCRVSVLKEKLKNSVPVSQLASKLSARDAEHKQGTKDLWDGLRRLHEEVNEMRAAEEHLKISHQAELNQRGECHRKETEGYLKHIGEVLESHKKLTEDYQRQFGVL
ncbi:hypothetical protein ACQ4PT_068524 [Festuca glaucescens]